MPEQIYCGAAKRKITPSPELLPYMFGLMGRQYCKVRDELFVRVLAFRAGKKTALIVVYDLDKATHPAEWPRRIEEETGVPADDILYLAIHTHTAPLTGYRPFEGPNFIERKPPEVQAKVREYEAFLLGQLLDAAKAALAGLVPARFGYARGKCDIGVNRCAQYDVKNEDGTVSPMVSVGFCADGTADRTLLALRVENASTGAPIAFFTNYAVHCVAGFLNDCGGGKSFLSADIGGEVSRALEAEHPGSVALWTSGPAGDINPVQMVQTFHPDLTTGAPVERRIVGEDAADAAITAMAGRQLAAIRAALGRVTCDIGAADIKTAVDRAVTKCTAFADRAAGCGEDYTIRTHLLQIGPLALIGIDGELYTSHGQAMKAASPVADTFILNHDSSLLLDNPGYIMDDATIARLDACGGRGSQRGGIPGGGTYTRPGTVKAVLEESTRRLFLRVQEPAAPFDWTCTHRILLRGPDDALRPMDEPYFSSQLIAPGTWKVFSAGDYSYLLAGDGEAILIDSGYGAGDIRRYCEELCGLPVRWIANTHEHFDHTANNGRFDLAFMTARAQKNATIPFSSFAGVTFPRDYPVQTVKTGDIIPLAGRSLEVFELADHSPGGAVYLDRKARILFSGDEMWEYKPLKGNPDAYARYLETITAHREAYDVLWGGTGRHEADLPDKLLALCRRAAAGEPGQPAEPRPNLTGPWQEILPDGTLVYDRIRPHLGDGGAGQKPPHALSELRVLTDGDVTLQFFPGP